MYNTSASLLRRAGLKAKSTNTRPIIKKKEKYHKKYKGVQYQPKPKISPPPPPKCASNHIQYHGKRCSTENSASIIKIINII